ncbi:MAG: peptidase dimerization domain-containing protein, partial [Firmicutes bacterium]|nr:peptidase dimerization domain-containing protein [Bacillota bacterium]
IYYGCPAEEGGSGKAFMARDGIFDDLDAAITWHPSSVNNIADTSSLANVQVKYQYKGISAHAAGDPEHGRSALDALELLNIGVQFLREHMPSDARIHYAITDTGGKSPNVVQSYAEAIYLIRSPKNEQVQKLMERVDKIAQGAALMTETELNKVFMKGCSNTVLNTALNEVLHRNLCELPIPPLTEEEAEYRARLNTTVAEPYTPKPYLLASMSMDEKAAFIEKCRQDDIDFVFPLVEGPAMGGSTDVADVSWICPTAQVHTATWCSRSPGHSWQNVAQTIGSAAKKRTVFAGQVMAGSVIDLMENPEIVEKAKEELKMREPGGYKCPIPKGVMPQPTV